MDPKLLIDKTLEPGLPAPVWFIDLFKVLGFSLHEVPMNLWYAGIITAMILYARGSVSGRRFATRLMTQMPIIIAMGINLGIVPLLFIQVGYAKVFYPATVLMAWFWMAIIAVLIPAYYGVYIYAFGLKEGPTMKPWKQAAGWCAAGAFLIIGFLFANGLSLLENIGGWPQLWQDHSVHGAAVGTALNVGDGRFWPRWLLMFGIALTTTAAWVAFDAAWFGRKENQEYHAWAREFSWKLYLAGVTWFAVAGAWYSLGTWSAEAKGAMFSSPLVFLTIFTVAAPAGPALILWRNRSAEPTRLWASALGLAQFAVLGINAISRHVVQNIELRRYEFDVWTMPTNTQWSAMALFLGTFVVGLAVVVWMIWQVVKLSAEPDAV